MLTPFTSHTNSTEVWMSINFGALFCYTYLEKPKSFVQLVFVDYSSAF